METLDPPLKIKDGKMARFCPLRGFIVALGVGGGGGDWMGFSLPLYSVQDCKIGQNKWKT